MKYVNTYVNLYVNFLKPFIKLKRPLRVVFDCSNGTTGIVLRRLKIPNSKFIILNSKPDGNFPAHGPNPAATGALKQLSRAVKRYRADLGVAFDADGDRAIFVDEKGEPVEPYIIAHLIFLNHEPPFVVDIFNFEALKYSNLLKNTFPSKVGTRFIKESMEARGAGVGAEYSGHYYFKESFGADDAVLATIKIINAVSQLPYPLSHFKMLLPHKLSIQQFNFEIKEPEKLPKIIKRHYGKTAKKISEIDGVTLEFEKGWFTVRPSNTEPLLRVFIGKWIY